MTILKTCQYSILIVHVISTVFQGFSLDTELLQDDLVKDLVPYPG